MLDTRKALKNNSMLFLNDSAGMPTEFTIVNEIGRGGSCIVYEATFVQNNTLRHCRLKEFYPCDTQTLKYDIFRNDNGSIQVNNASMNSFSNKMQKFIEGCHKQINFFEELEDARNNIVYAKDIYNGNNTVYCKMLCDTGRNYAEIQDFSIKDTLLTIKATAVALKHYHNNGYLHLDVKPENIFILPETRELVKLFDYDSIINQENIYEGKLYLSGTLGYAAYELLKGNTDKIGTGCDIFSLGAILYERIYGKRYAANIIPDLPLSNAIFKNSSSKLYKPLMAFLNSTCNTRLHRYKSIDDVISALDEMIPLTEIQFPIKKNLPSAIGSFIGRKTEIDLLKKELASDKRLVFLQGFGGLGKTELAIKLANSLGDAYESSFIVYRGSMRDTIIHGLEFVNYSNYDDNDKYKGDAAIYKDKINLLSNYNSKLLLIVDNFDTDGDIAEILNEPEFREVANLGITLLVTTRNYVDGCIEIGNLHQEELMTLMQGFYPAAMEHKEVMIKILDVINNHTLLAELVSKSIAKSRGRISPKSMLDALSKNDYDNELFKKVSSNKDGLLYQDKIYNHINKLFDMSMLSNQQLEIMQNMSLLPLDGMDYVLFVDLKGAENEDDLDVLIDKGWCECDNNNKLHIHPMVRTIAMQKMSILFSTKSDLYKSNKYINNVAKNLTLYKVNNMRNLHQVLNSALMCTQINIGQNNMATLYNNIGIAYGECFDMSKQLLYYKKSIALREKIYIQNNDTEQALLLAKLYSNIGSALINDNKPDESLDYLLKALDICGDDKTHEDSKDFIAGLYNNLGVTLKCLKKKEHSLHYFLRALELLVEILQVDSTNKSMIANLANTCNNIGLIYLDNEEFDEAFDYFKKALKLQTNAIYSEHPDFINTYCNIALSYETKKQYKEAIEYYEKALCVVEKTNRSNPMHKHILEKLGYLYWKIEDAEKSIATYEKLKTLIKEL